MADYTIADAGITKGETNMSHILQGQVAALFAFDVGYEVLMDKLSAMIVTTPVQPLSRKKQTPTYLQYTRPPQILSLGMATGHFSVAGSIQATIFTTSTWKHTPRNRSRC
jgi:hypothetical protein